MFLFYSICGACHTHIHTYTLTLFHTSAHTNLQTNYRSLSLSLTHAHTHTHTHMLIREWCFFYIFLKQISRASAVFSSFISHISFSVYMLLHAVVLFSRACVCVCVC